MHTHEKSIPSGKTALIQSFAVDDFFGWDVVNLGNRAIAVEAFFSQIAVHGRIHLHDAHHYGKAALIRKLRYKVALLGQGFNLVAAFKLLKQLLRWAFEQAAGVAP